MYQLSWNIEPTRYVEEVKISVLRRSTCCIVSKLDFKENKDNLHDADVCETELLLTMFQISRSVMIIWNMFIFTIYG